ncbi:hypothetical protein K504DRAFT_408203 [Pleomassaria siparia CBS 279.74]|uniref:Transcription factor domain-containing protein n=1 Tax=Pleomassaria siparia CBS 279.74 TaxID=1314801 RepID=A0A6G1K7Q3_9PLEO|nr:hypothetical protein K504DRAFT_408203 [Pleomassaria siparia CBS 279.74]
MAGSDEFKESSAAMPFIVTVNTEKVDTATRKLIRSHVMRGKKEKKKKKKRPTHRNQTIPAQETQIGHSRITWTKTKEVSEMYTQLVRSRVGSDFSFTDHVAEVDSSILLNITKVTPLATRVIYPLLAVIGYQADNQQRHYPIGRDVASVYITAFAVQGFIDKVLRRQRSINPATMLLFQKGLKLLNEILQGVDDETKISDSTMGMVLKLASAAHFEGDRQASKQHIKGLQKMVDLRGGLDAFENTELQVEMLRCDMSIAILDDSDPVFFCRPSEPVFQYPDKLLLPSDFNRLAPDNTELMPRIENDDLATAWRVMKRFCSLVSLGAQTQRMIHPDLIHNTATAVVYRLLHMSFASDSVDETIRHGLLAFSYHVFLQWQDIKLPNHSFSSLFQQRILELTLVHGISPQLMVWLLMTGAISVFRILDEAWLMEHLRKYVDKCHVKTWKDMQYMLKSFMWISLLDEESGEKIYNSIPPVKGK